MITDVRVVLNRRRGRINWGGFFLSCVWLLALPAHPAAVGATGFMFSQLRLRKAGFFIAGFVFAETFLPQAVLFSS